jgi:hypothetical protein
MILLDFRRSPFSFIKGLRSRALNGLNDNNAIISYLITYPLIAACSLIVREKNKPFVPEYIIPQILLAWIRKNKKYRGIAYFTCSKYDDAREVHSYNIVIPPVEVSTHVHCGRLEKEFKLTSPQFCDIPKFFGSFSSNFEKVKSIRTKLHEIVTKSEYFFDPMREILSAYDSLIIIIDRITSNDNPDIEMLYQYLDTTSKILYQLTNKEYLNQINDQINNLNKTEDFRTIALKICKDVWDDLNYVYIQSSQFWYFGLNSLETNLDFQSIHPI